MKYAVLVLLLFGSLGGFSQTSAADESAIRAPIERLFKGMATGDSAMVHSAFSTGATFVSMGTDKQGKHFKRNEKLSDFLIAVGTPHKEIWNEEIWGVKILRDDDLAQVWCDYGFYQGNIFNHCGVDAFHLHNDGTGWKIFHLADTRRKEPCKIPDDIQKKHGQ